MDPRKSSEPGPVSEGEEYPELREEDVRVGDQLSDRVSEDDQDWPEPEPAGS